MRREYADRYERLWREHWWWRARRRFVLGWLERLAGPGRRLGRILDIGCGNGLFFDDLARFGEVRGIEPDAGMVADDGPWRERIEVAPFERSSRHAQRFHAVLMLDVLEHIEDDRGAARRVADMLVPGGAFLVTVPALPALWSAHDDANHHHRRYRRPGLRAVLEDAGLRLLELRYFFGWTVPALFARRLRHPGGARGAADGYEVGVPPAPVNRALYGLSVVEQAVTARLGAPLGSSLLAIAQTPGPARRRPL